MFTKRPQISGEMSGNVSHVLLPLLGIYGRSPQNFLSHCNRVRNRRFCRRTRLVFQSREFARCEDRGGDEQCLFAVFVHG